MWSRLHGAGVQADQALGVVPQQTILAVGARQLLFPAAIAIGIVFLTLWIERNASASAKQDPDRDARRKQRAQAIRRRFRVLRAAVRRLPGPIRRPFQWYFRYVPQLLWYPLPVIFISNDPLTFAIFYAQATVGAATGNWLSATTKSTPTQLAKVAVAIAAPAAIAGILFQWHNPTHLPTARVAPERGEAYQAGYVAVEGEQAYLVRGEALTITPTAGIRTIRVVSPPKREPIHEPSLADRLFGLVP